MVACMSQVHHITATMHTALQWVTHFHVSVRHTLHHSTTEVDARSCEDGEIGCANRATPSIITDSLQAVVRAALDMFAACVPLLEKLSVSGEVGLESAILVFGAHCPKLCALKMDLFSRPSTALQHINNRLPNLNHLTFTTAKCVGVHKMGSLNEPSLLHLRECAHLAVLKIDFTGIVLCDPGCWDLAPNSLEEISYNCCMMDECMPPELCARLKRLTTTESLRGTNLQDYLAPFPLLEALTVLDYHVVELLHHGSGNSPQGVLPLRQRFAAGFKLTCSRVMFCGSSEQVRDALEWLPSLPSVTTCSFHFTGTTHVHCLQHIVRVLPNLRTIHLGNAETDDEEVPNHTDAEFFQPLLACKALEHVYVLMHVSFTTLWLFNLCRSLPVLHCLEYVECEGVDDHVLRGALPLVLVGRVVNIKVYTQDDFHISEDGDAEEEEDADEA